MSVCVRWMFTWREPLTKPSSGRANIVPDRFGTSPGLSETKATCHVITWNIYPVCLKQKQHVTWTPKTSPLLVWNRSNMSCVHLKYLPCLSKTKATCHVNTWNVSPFVWNTSNTSCEHLEHLLVCLKQNEHTIPIFGTSSGLSKTEATCHVNVWNIWFI